MKPRGDDSSSRSCSCTSCFYKTESEHPSMRRVLAKGSRIDKLFVGKYLPLREEKLLNRLVRTRAIYDDIRTQLLSDSNVSESDKGDLKPAKQMPLKREGNRKDKELSDAERSSVLLQLINLVDRGATLGPHRLSECCSCCVCGPKANTFGETGRPQKHKHRHASSRSSFTSGMKTHDERRFASHGHRARYIKSDPCNCTNEDCNLNVRGSKALMKKDRKPGVGSKEIVTQKKVGGRQKIKGYKTRQGMGEAFSQSITKLKKSKSQMSAKLRSKIKKSMDIMKATERGVRGKIRKHTKKYKHSEILYSLRGGKRRKKTEEELELEVKEAIAKIKKDSLTKIREDMKKKKFIEEWACNFECDPKECEPEDCLKIKLQQKMRRGEKKVGDTIRILSKTRISQTKIPVATTKTETKKQETMSADLKKNTESNEPQIKSKNKHEETETNQPKQNSKNEGICECKTTTSSTNTNKRSITELPSTTTKTISSAETIRQKLFKPKASIVIQIPKRNVRSGGYALKRCFCTLKLRPKGNKPQRPRSSDSKSVQTKTSHTRSTTASTRVLCECEIPKARSTTKNTRGLKHHTKSTSSLKSKSNGGSKIVEQLVIKRKDDEPTSNKQAVRISSSFSFNIEFYKETPSTQKIAASETDTQSQVFHSQKQIHRKLEKYKRLANNPSQMTSSVKSKNTLTKHNLRRCFCTLRFAKKDVICECAPKMVTYSKGTLTYGQSFTEKPILRNTGTEKRLQRPKYAKYQLLPYECEPGICVPGECDPYQCLKVISKRNAKQTTRASETFNRKTRSTYSITGRRGNRSKTKKVQSVSTTHKEDKSLVIPERKVASSPSRQAVRFGSSFSFDVEFYKDKPNDTQLDIEIIKEPSSSLKLKTIKRQKNKTKHQKSTSVQSNTKAKGIFVGSPMKRCFCTLKLQKKAKKQVVSGESSTAAAETVPAKYTIHPDMVTRSTQMKKKRFLQLGLLPYECEPGICVPGECDPYQCLERIKTRNKKVKDFGTGTNKNKSAASTTSSSKSRNALTQSNLGEIRKKRKRSKYTTSSSYPKVPIPVVSKSSRQAVRIGSNFSLNIEFAKKGPKEVQLLDKPLVENPIRNVRVKEKGENSNKTKSKHSESQSTAVKKINKDSRIKPILNRCFCTLKLQNNKTNLNRQTIAKPVETIVMPALGFNKSFALSQHANHTKYYVVRKKNIEQNDIDRSSLKPSLPKATTSNDMNWFSRSIITLSTVSPFNITKTLNREERGSKNLSKENNKTTELNLRRSQLIGVSPYLKKSFYALNLHVQHQQKKVHKLLPYECEPGVCIPEECDPHECLKLINKRLMKRFSTMTTTDNRSQSTSSGGTRVRSSQQQFGRTRQERADKLRNRIVKAPRAIKYESPPTPTHQTHKQAVRVGSTFSFDIEFFKDKSSPGNKDVVQEKRKKDHNVVSGGTVRRNHKGTRASQILHRDTASQSSIMTHNKGQNITRPKRCFCTLKLQKRGKQHVQVGHEAKPTVQYTNTGQNTKNRNHKLLDLDPNECEPGVCIPGECDPYECLERIKRRRRKDFGSGMRPSMISSSSMTNPSKKHARGKHVQINEKRRRAGGSKSTVSSVSRPSVTKTSVHSSRQAVRIGSSFSFNVEFYKDRSHGQGGPMTASDPAPVKMKTKTKDDNENTRIRPSPSSMGRSSQDSTTLRHQKTQHIGLNTRAIGTKTGAFLKRCFCTAKFFQKSPPNGVQVVGVPANVKATPSLMQRCLCTLKLLTAKHKPKHDPKRITSLSSPPDKIKEKNIKPMKQLKLEPYECEPEICVPGQCDPYECLERINRRNRLHKMSSTENAGTRSTSTGFRSSRSAGSYARTRTKEKRHGDRKQKYAQPVYAPVVKPVTITPSLNRNIVRIGSNFNFDVEFYKDQKSPTYQNVQRVVKEVKKKRLSKSTASAIAGRKAKNRGVNKYDQSHSRDSQADFIKKEDRATGMLKRCFCTLALHKQAGRDKVSHQRALIVKEQGTESPYYKTYPTVENKNTITKRPYKLEPYECEPGVCIPGECDPYECLKRIQRRREQGTSTLRHRTSSSSTLMRQRRKLRDHHAQSVTRHKKVARPSQQRTRPSRASRPSRQTHYGDQGQDRQAVRIGSNFCFNIEFSKSRTGGDQTVKIVKEPRAKRYETRNTSSKPERRGSTRSTKSQGRRRVRDSDSQVLGNKVRSTLTETTPFLKRCFCTLKFKNMDRKLQDGYKKAEVIKHSSTSNVPKYTPHREMGVSTPKEKLKNMDKKPHDGNKKAEVIKPSTSNVPKYTQHREMGVSTPKEKPFKNLRPVECEPGVCVPGQCDPYECLKRIEKRNMQTKMASTDRPRGRGVSTVTAETKTSSKSFQNRTGFRPKRTHSHARDGRVPPVRKQHVTHSTRNKQAVRVGSNFSFDVEFFKNKTNKTPFHTNTPNVYSTLVSTKNITTDPGLKKYSTAMSSSDRKLINRQSQSIARKTTSSGSGVGPLLKRCFCTLKLQKLGRLQRPSRSRTNSKLIKKPMSTNKTLDSTLIKYKDTGMGIKKRFRDLLPYECEPNICVPGQCNPHECLEKIKRRNMCDSTTNCMNRNTKPVSRGSLAGRKSQIRNLQALSDRPGVNKSNDIRSKGRKRDVNLTETDNGDRPAVRIGSNISFNIEFYKEHTPKNIKNVTFDTLPKIERAYNTREEKLPKTISRGSFYQSQSTRHKELQARVGQEHRASGIKPLLQKCFCTLKLLEGNKQQKPLESDVQVSHEAKQFKKPSLQFKNTGQNTKKHQNRLSDLDPNECEPGVCIPGECDPYECLQRIKRRNIRHRATEVSSGGRHSQASLTSFGPISKSKRIQYSPKQKGHRAMSNIVEQPRFPFLEPQYYQGLKIGSNVSVNIEFYKEYALPTNGKETKRISRESKNVAQDRFNQTCSKPDIYKGSSMKTNTCTRSRNYMQQAGVKTEDESSFVGNALKRCFCTAKLVDRPTSRPLMTVGRVDKLITNSPFQPKKLQIYQMHQTKAKNQYSHCDPNCIILKSLTQNAATRINDKYFSGDPLSDDQKGNKNSDEMKTILPYAPKKFNKNESKTLVMRKKKSNKKDCKETGSSYKDDVPYSKSAKRLTGKHEKTLITNQKGLKHFMCTCINNIFKNKNKPSHCGKDTFKVDDDDNNTNTKVKAPLKMSKSERKTVKKQKNHIKKSKSLNAKNTKVTPTNPFVCPHCQACFDNKSKISEVKKAGGDMRTSKNKRTPEETVRGMEKQNENKSKSKGRHDLYSAYKDEKRLGKNNLDEKQYGLKLTKKGKTQGEKGRTRGEKGRTRGEKGKTPGEKGKTQREKGKTQGKEVRGKQTPNKSKKPCICGSSVCAKVAKKEKLAKAAQTLQKSKKTGKLCVCGSPVCAEEAKKMQGTKDTKRSNKDDKQTKKADKKAKNDNIICQCIHPKKKAKLEKKKIVDYKLLKRRKQYAKEDAIRKRKRLKKDIELYQQVIKTKNAGDCALLTESMLDIAKLGCATAGDVICSTYRTITDPKNTAQNITTCIRDPRRGLSNIKQAFLDSGFGSTCKRVILRFKMMKRFRNAKEGLESCAATNYLIHINDPKLRLKPKKKKKARVPTDFECSPYMASLRNRPFLFIYFACPWFYPHCLSMLNIWRQFTDILLFLLAVIVWSPCILLMEGCRAMMCCFLCTG